VEAFSASSEEPQDLAELKKAMTQVFDTMQVAARDNKKAKNTAFILVCLSGLLFTYEYCRHGSKITPSKK